MNQFFRVIKELPADLDNRTVIGIDGALAGEKAVLSGNKIVYRSADLDVWEQAAACENPGLIQTVKGRIFLENLGTMKKIILCGGGHVSSATLSIARMTEFHITVIEDRPAFAQTAKEQGADIVICDDFTRALEKLKTDKDTYALIMTRGHRHDLSCLKIMLQKEYAYLGMMGSKSRIKRIREQLEKEGFGRERLNGLHAPVGLSISARTPAEIGVSVMAEIIQEKNRQNRQNGYDREVAAWLFCEEEREPAVLATIVGRKGSAPRSIGTKMLIFRDGGCIGTIGGGCMEAEVCGRARHMLADGAGKRFGTCFADMTGREAEEEGMVCGGTLEIFLEIL